MSKIRTQQRNRSASTRATHLRGFFIAVALLVISGCSDPAAELPKLSADARILAFGDSLTFGTGAGRDESYPAELARLTQRQVINAGIPGEVSADGLARLPAQLDKTQPGLLILCHGGNDLLRKKDLNATRANIAKMIELARARGIAVVLIGVPKPGLLLGTADFYKELVDELKIPADLKIMANTLSNAGLKSDAIHPNAKGYALIAQSLYGLLQRSGAL